MLFNVTLQHSPDNCWGHPENEGKASELVERLENSEEHGVTVRSAHVAPSEHTFFLVLESESFEGLTALLGGALLADHHADVVPVTTLVGAMDALGIDGEAR
jgi:hypothetical protein